MTRTATMVGRHRAVSPVPPRRDPYRSTVACPWCGAWFATFDESPGIRFCDSSCVDALVLSRCREVAA